MTHAALVPITCPTPSGSLISVDGIYPGAPVMCTRTDGATIVLGTLAYFKSHGVWALEPNRTNLIAYAPETLRVVADILEMENE